MMVGSFFYMRFRADYSYGTVYDAILRYYRDKLILKKGFDREKLEQLQSYKLRLEKKLHFVRKDR
jgi:hypothetical protein